MTEPVPPSVDKVARLTAWAKNNTFLAALFVLVAVVAALASLTSSVTSLSTGLSRLTASSIALTPADTSVWIPAQDGTNDQHIDVVPTTNQKIVQEITYYVLHPWSSEDRIEPATARAPFLAIYLTVEATDLGHECIRRHQDAGRPFNDPRVRICGGELPMVVTTDYIENERAQSDTSLYKTRFATYVKYLTAQDTYEIRTAFSGFRLIRPLLPWQKPDRYFRTRTSEFEMFLVETPQLGLPATR